MASPAQYQIQSEHTSGSTAKHYHGASISTLNEWAKNNIPPNAIVTSIRVYYRGKTSLGDTKLYVGFSNSSSDEPSQKLISTEIKTSAGDGWTGYIPSYSSTHPFNINTSYSTLSVYMNSGIIYKKFTCYDFRVLWDFYIPTYTVTVKAGTGGTVSGGGTVESGSTVTITATASTGYKFKQWNDGNTSASRTVTVTGNATYTAEFASQEYPVNVICEPSVSGEVCTVSGAGTYKFGDTVTLKVTNIPPYHSFNGWDVVTGKKVYKYKTETITFTLNEDTIGGNEASINAYCSISHTGYKIGVNVYPDTSAGTVQYVQYIDGTYVNFGDVTNTEVIMKYGERGKAGLRAMPLNHYTFVKWNDGNTDNPRMLPLTDDATYTAVFGVNLLYIGNQLPKAIYVGTQEVKEVFIGTERVYLKSDY